jgi:hypothetical protein
MTLLEIVQDILNDLDSDPVNSINDTVEAEQVAQIVKTTYNLMVDGKHYPHLYELFQFEALGSISKPNYLKIPTTIVNVEWLKYNTRSLSDTKNKFTDIKFKDPQEFLRMVDARDSSASNIQVVSDFSTVTLNILNDKAPQYYTSFDDSYIILDSFDSTIDTTIQASKSSGWGRRSTSFTISDTFIPDLPVQQFSYLLAEAKSNAFSILKQALNPKVEVNAKSQRNRMSQEAWKLNRGVTYPNFGRK